MHRNTAEYIVEAIIEDLRDRGVLGDAWDSISEEVQDEIAEAWTDLVMDDEV